LQRKPASLFAFQFSLPSLWLALPHVVPPIIFPQIGWQLRIAGQFDAPKREFATNEAVECPLWVLVVQNALAIASTPRDDGDVAARGHFRRLVDFSVWKRF
jgi:hypothetical protein